MDILGGYECNCYKGCTRKGDFCDGNKKLHIRLPLLIFHKAQIILITAQKKGGCRKVAEIAKIYKISGMNGSYEGYEEMRMTKFEHTLVVM